VKRDSAYVRHMLDCIRRIEAATADGRAAFLDSDLAQDAVARNLQTLTESSKRLSSEVKTERPEIEWARMRHSATSSFTTTWGLMWSVSGT